MASIDFYYMPESPPCRAVEMAASLMGVKLNKHYINLFTQEHLKEEYLKVNPKHKVPFIVDGNVKIGESRAILCYLANKYQKPGDDSLYPKDPCERARVDELLYYDIGTLYASISQCVYPIFKGMAKEIDPEARAALMVELKATDKRLSDNGAKRFMLGNHLTIADVSLAATLNLPVAIGIDMSEFPNMTNYLERLKAAIPNYSEINDAANENMKKFFLSKTAAK